MNLWSLCVRLWDLCFEAAGLRIYTAPLPYLQSTNSSMLVEFVASSGEAHSVFYSVDKLLENPHIVRTADASQR